MHAVATRGLRITLQPDQPQLFLDELRGFDNQVERAFHRVEIDEGKVGFIERSNAAHPGILIDARQIGQVEQRGAIVGDHVMNVRAAARLRFDRLHANPVGEVFRILLEEKLLIDTVRVPL